MVRPVAGSMASRSAVVSLGIKTPLLGEETSRIAEGCGLALVLLMPTPTEAWVPVAPVIPVLTAHTGYHSVP